MCKYKLIFHVIQGYIIVPSPDVKQKCRINAGIGATLPPEQNGWKKDYCDKHNI